MDADTEPQFPHLATDRPSTLGELEVESPALKPQSPGFKSRLTRESRWVVSCRVPKGLSPAPGP